ncbi:2-phospho-L-lactate transferase [Propionibacteriaceae bacterium Y2011]
MQVVVLAGGVGGSKFVRGVLAALPTAEVTVIGNTADDITVHGLRVCPDLDTMMYALGGGISTERGWGRDDETFATITELRSYGVEPTWFGLGDKDLATHLVRTQLWNAGVSLTDITAALATRWLPDRVRLLPMTDARVETHVVVADPDAPSGRRSLHFQEYWVRLHAEPTALATVQVGIEQARPTQAVRDAVSDADVILVAPSNPVVSIGPILAVPGMREDLTSAAAPVIGFSGIIGNRPVLGMADKLIPTLGIDCTAEAVGRHYGFVDDTSFTDDTGDRAGLLDGWLVDQADADAAARLVAEGLPTLATPLLMTDPESTARFVREAIDHFGPGCDVDHPAGQPRQLA